MNIFFVSRIETGSFNVSKPETMKNSLISKTFFVRQVSRGKFITFSWILNKEEYVRWGTDEILTFLRLYLHLFNETTFSASRKEIV
jgi:hypothetical protein